MQCAGDLTLDRLQVLISFFSLSLSLAHSHHLLLTLTLSPTVTHLNITISPHSLLLSHLMRYSHLCLGRIKGARNLLGKVPCTILLILNIC